MAESVEEIAGQLSGRFDPGDSFYEAARAQMVAILDKIGEEDDRNGYAAMAADLSVGQLMQVPTWIALGMIAEVNARDHLAKEQAK